jgi:glycosyltransferase involved in cell wall biosynthesis
MIREHVLAKKLASPAKLAVIRNGLDWGHLVNERETMRRELLAELNLPDNVFLVGKIANLRAVKGHRHLITAAEYIIDEFPRAHFVFIGEGELRDRLQRQAQDLGIARHFHFLGQRPQAARYNAAFDLAVLASLHEGMPNAVLEAMSAGTAVVATEVGGVKELITDGETGLLALPGNPANLAARITQALLDDGERQRLANAGRTFVLEHFGMERMVSETAALYEEMANCPSASFSGIR